MVAIPVNHKEGEDHQGKSKESAHNDQFVPVGLGVGLQQACLSWQVDGFILGDLGCMGTAGRGGALLLGLAPHAVVCQQLSEAFLYGPALVGFLPVSLGHHHQSPLWAWVMEVTSRLTELPLTFSQIRARLAR